MKRITLKNLAILLLAIGIVGFYSCGKKKLNNATTSSEDNDLAEALFSDIFNEISEKNKTADDGLNKTKTGMTSSILTDSCAVITWTPSADSTYVNSVTIDYGTGCVHNGRTRKGKIKITRNGRWFTVGTVTTATLENFSIDDYAIKGTKTITTAQATIQLTSPYITASFDVSVKDGKITTPDNDVLTWESTRNHTWTLELTGVYLRVTGSASGTNRNDIDYTMDITKTLAGKVGCPNIIEGILKISSADVKNDIIIDYGDGTCDKKATIQIGNKKAKDFTLR